MGELIYFYSTPQEMLYRAFSCAEIEQNAYSMLLDFEANMNENDQYEDLVDEMCNLKSLSIRYQVEIGLDQEPSHSKLPSYIKNSIQTIKEIVEQGHGSKENAEKLIQFVIDSAIEQVVPFVKMMTT